MPFESPTRKFRRSAEIAESIEDIRVLLQQLTQRQAGWSSFLRAEMESRGLTTAALARRTGVTRQGVERWKNEGVEPGTRLAYLKLGMALEMNADQLDFMLQRYGRFPKLYAKNLDDALCLFALNARQTHSPACEPYREYPYGHVEALKRKLHEQLALWEQTGLLAIHSPTPLIQRGLVQYSSDDDFLLFVRENKAVFLTPSYWQLEKMIESFIRIQHIDAHDASGNVTIHGLISAGMLNASLERLCLNLRAQNTVPSRLRLIAMGLSFNMTSEMIDQMLTLAGMEPLYARDRVELVLLYSLQVAHLFDPTMEYDIAWKLANQADDETLRARCAGWMAESEAMICNASKPYRDFYGVCDYVRYIFGQLEMREEASALLMLLPESAT